MVAHITINAHVAIAVCVASWTGTQAFLSEPRTGTMGSNHDAVIGSGRVATSFSVVVELYRNLSTMSLAWASRCRIACRLSGLHGSLVRHDICSRTLSLVRRRQLTTRWCVIHDQEKECSKWLFYCRGKLGARDSDLGCPIVYDMSRVVFG